MGAGLSTFLSSITASQVFSAVSGVSSLIGGLQGQAEAGRQSEYAIAQGNLAAKERERVAFKEAQVEKQNAEDAERRQKLAYLASGVTLEGSPLLVMEETRRKGSENVDEILRSGAAGASAERLEGRIQAEQYKSSGRQSFISGVTGAVQQFSKLK